MVWICDEEERRDIGLKVELPIKRKGFVDTEASVTEEDVRERDRDRMIWRQMIC